MRVVGYKCKDVCPELAARISIPGKKPASVPAVFREAPPPPIELIAGKEQGCLCTNCEGLEQFRHGQTAVVSALLDKDN